MNRGTSAPGRQGRVRAVVGLASAALLILAGCSGDSGDEDRASVATTTPDRDGVPSAGEVADLLPLRAVRGAEPTILDANDRQVLLRGVNLNGLGDYYQANPDLPPNVPVSEDDFEEMAAQGFSVVRLLVSWSRLAPRAGTIDDDYVDDIRLAVDQAGAHGLYVVLDMHQDAFSKYVATPPGEVCPEGTTPAKGWDGAPEWATITDGASTCIIGGIRETSPASVTAFENFWTDRDGIQTAFVDAWTALVTEFAADPAVAGYDLFNEPSPGSGADQEPERLGRFYDRAIEAIRDAEDAADGGFGHIVFFEPHAAWGTFGTLPVPGPAFTDDANIVFAPHLYAGSIAPTVTVEQGFAYAAEAAEAYEVTFWSGEWGWFEENDENLAQLATYAREEDRHLVGGTWWQWFQSCGDPHSVDAANGFEPSEELTHFRRTGCPGDVDLGPVEGFATVLSRTYPRAAPGRLSLLESDPDTGEARVEGGGDPQGPTPLIVDLWVPDRGTGEPDVTGDGVVAVDVVEVAGGFRVLVEVENDYDLIVTP